MTTEETKRQQIKDDTAKYFNAMMDAHASGGNFEDHIDLAGMEALQQITMGIPIPTVTELEGGRMVGYDLFSRLMKDRIVMLLGQVDGSMSAVACASLLFLAHIDKDGAPITDGSKAPPIQVFIDSPGGSVIAGNAIYDTMRSINAEVITVGMGMQASMGSVLLAAGDVRKMTRSSKLMIHAMSSGTNGDISGQHISLDFTDRLSDEGNAIYVRHIGLTAKFWELACAAPEGTWLSADQALKMGFIHEVITGDRKLAPYEKAAADFLRAAQDKRESAVAGKTLDELKEMLFRTGGKGGEAERSRPEVIVALSQMPEFWTEEKKMEMAAKAAVAAPANDDNVAVAPQIAIVKESKKFGGPAA